MRMKKKGIYFFEDMHEAQKNPLKAGFYAEGRVNRGACIAVTG